MKMFKLNCFDAFLIGLARSKRSTLLGENAGKMRHGMVWDKVLRSYILVQSKYHASPLVHISNAFSITTHG